MKIFNIIKINVSKKTGQAIVFIGLGFLLILLSIAFHSFYIFEICNKNILFLNELFINILSHVGIGFLAVGLISIMLDMEHWIHYFEERLKKIVIDKSYLRNLDDAALTNLQVEVLKAYFKNDSIAGSDGFLNYYQKNIQSIIGSPFRVNININLQINKVTNDDEILEVNETMSYTCKMNSGKIQNSIIYLPEEGEHYKSIEFNVSLQHEELKGKEKANASGKIDFNNDYLMNIDNEIKNGFSLDISNYNFNNLYVLINAKYLIKKHRFFAWRMSHPTRNIALSIQYPREMKLESEYFIHDNNSIFENINPEIGVYNFSINGWLMPEEGTTFQLIENITLQQTRKAQA